MNAPKDEKFQPVHERKDVSDGSGAEGRFSRDWALAAVGQGRPHHGQRLAIQLQRASLREEQKRLKTQNLTPFATFGLISGSLRKTLWINIKIKIYPLKSMLFNQIV